MPAVPLIALAYVAGSLMPAFAGGPWVLSLALGVLGYAALWFHRLAPPLLIGLTVVCFAAVGHARAGHSAAVTAEARAGLDGRHQAEGVVTSRPTVRGSTASVDVTLRSVDGQASRHVARMTVRIAAEAEAPRIGDVVAITGDFEAQTRPWRGRFDATTAYPHWQVVRHEPLAWPVGLAAAVRTWAVANIERSLPEPHASLATGVLIGEQGAIPPSLAQALRTTGTTHLVVVSGQNIAILLGAAVALLSAVIPRRGAALAALVLLPGYVLLVGAAPPVIRAAVMAVCLVIAAASGRRTPAWVFLSYALAVMLAFDPGLAHDLSFHLSAAATAGVLLVAPPLTEALAGPLAESRLGRGVPAAIAEAAMVAVAAALTVLPVQAAAFGTASLIQVPANAAVSPLYEATLALATIAALIGWLDPIATLLRAAGAIIPGTFIALVEAFARLPGTSAHVALSPAIAVAWYVALAALIRGVRTRAARVSTSALSVRSSLPVRRIALAAIAVGLWVAVLSPRPALAQVTVLDVGQGLAVLVRDRGRAVLVDTGPPDGAVIAALHRAGHRGPLDAVILTHDDADHTGGTAEVLRRFGAGRVLGAPHIAVRPPGGVGQLDSGDLVRVSEQTTIDVLAPAQRATARNLSDNDASLVLMVTIGARRVLIPADIEAATERWLVEAGHALRADAVVVPHHGSRTSSTTAFVRAVSPRVGVVSVGARNPHGHPAAEVLARYAGAHLVRTDEAGDVDITTDGTRLWLQTARRPAEGAQAVPRATVGPGPESTAGEAAR